MVVGAANVLNNYLERDVDALMRRTWGRPLPAGRVEPATALALGIVLPVFAIPMLALAANPLTALLALVALVSYAFVYTPMKRWTTAALFVGAVPGAIPPLMGWTAATGHDRRPRARPLRPALRLAAAPLPRHLDLPEGGLRARRPQGLRAGPRGAGGQGLGGGHERPARPGGDAARLPGHGHLGLRRPSPRCSAEGSPLAAATGLRRPDGEARWARNFFLSTLLYLVAIFIALFLGAR